jgi:hypothetical protein
MEIEELQKLSRKIKANRATTTDKEMLLEELYRRKKITQEQRNKYKDELNVESVIKFLLILAGIILLGKILLGSDK